MGPRARWGRVMGWLSFETRRQVDGESPKACKPVQIPWESEQGQTEYHPGWPQSKAKPDAKGNETADDWIFFYSYDDWIYSYDEPGILFAGKMLGAHGTEFGQEGYPLTATSCGQDGGKYDEWSSFEYGGIFRRIFAGIYGHHKNNGY